MFEFTRDIRFALRSLARRPTFAAIAVGTLALGIGASTSIYTVVDGVLFRPLPFSDPGRLIAVWQTYPKWKKEPILARSWDRISFSIPEYREWRDAQQSFTAVGIWNTVPMMLGDGDTREQVNVTQVSSTLLDVLQVEPFLGHFFSPSDDRLGAEPAAIVSYEAWQTRFGGNPNVVGTPVHFDRGTMRVIGVLPKGLSLAHGAPAARRASCPRRPSERSRAVVSSAIIS